MRVKVGSVTRGTPIAIILAASVAAGGCGGPSASPSPNGDLPIDMSGLVTRLPGPDEEALTTFGQMVDQSLVDRTRLVGGIAEALGDAASPVFGEADAARKAVLARVTEQEADAFPWGVELASVGRPMVPTGVAPVASSKAGVSFVAQMGSRGFAGGVVAWEKVPGNDGDYPGEEASARLSEGAAEVTFAKSSTLAGSLMIVQGTMTVRIGLPDPPGGTLVEQYVAKIVVPVCPDLNGAVPLTLEFVVTSAIEGSTAGSLSGETKLTAAADGTVDDEANLAGVTVAANASGRATSRVPGQQAQGAYGEIGLDVSYARSGSDAFGTLTSSSSRVIHHSSRETDEALASLGTTALLAEVFLIRHAFGEAEELWRSGFCVEINVTDPPGASKRGVAPDSTHAIAAEVRHRRDGERSRHPSKLR